MRNIILLAIALLPNLGCEKRYSVDPNAKSTVDKVTLIGLPAEKLVRTKYQSLKVACQISSSPPAPTQAAIPQAEWDLLNEFSISREIELSLFSFRHELRLVVKLDRLAVHQSTQGRDDRGRAYLIQNTPTLQARVEWQQQSGQLLQGSTSRTALVERVPTKLIGLKAMTSETFFHDGAEELQVICELRAIAKPAYQDEFKWQN